MNNTSLHNPEKMGFYQYVAEIYLKTKERIMTTCNKITEGTL